MEKNTRAVIWYFLSFCVGAMKALLMISPGVCRHRPTCMAYAKRVIQTESWWRMGWLILKRFIRCNPFSSPIREGLTEEGLENKK
ncbi:MAG: membrane protein insertion efficiency factor YidD [Chitinivibrionales bacterium]|nr:membrane protein insertion efficiency factor YidD [Chitinivibrionales bacterium]